jgi:hypothetical protein
MKLTRIAAGLVGGAISLFGTAASAAVLLTSGVYTLDGTSFGSGLGVHAIDGTTGTTIQGTIGNTGDTLTLQSGETLNVDDNGQGLATFEGPFDDLLLTFTAGSAYTDLSFSFTNFTFDKDNLGTFAINIDGGATEFTGVQLSQPNLNNFSLLSSGAAFHTVQFTFAPAVLDAKQLRLQVGGAGGIPEPATWAMMILGFGGVGTLMRRRRAAGALAA